MITIETSMGTIQAELWPDKSPKTVANFLQYVEEGYYDGLVFHRVIPGFMIQGGGMDDSLREKASKHEPVPNEASAETGNDRGTLAMARTSDPHSATSQFFINVADNDFLNHSAPTPQGYGYCVFGKVTAGLDVVDAIVAVATQRQGPHENVPVEPIVIQSIRAAE